MLRTFPAFMTRVYDPRYGPHSTHVRLATSRLHDNPRRKCFGERIVIFLTRGKWASDEVVRGRPSFRAYLDEGLFESLYTCVLLWWVNYVGWKRLKLFQGSHFKRRNRPSESYIFKKTRGILTFNQSAAKTCKINRFQVGCEYMITRLSKQRWRNALVRWGMARIRSYWMIQSFRVLWIITVVTPLIL